MSDIQLLVTRGGHFVTGTGQEPSQDKGKRDSFNVD